MAYNKYEVEDEFWEFSSSVRVGDREEQNSLNNFISLMAIW